MTATDEQRATHRRAVLWAHALSIQIDRLLAARTHAVERQRAVLKPDRRYQPEDSWPFYMLEADKHYAMTAARQLLRALHEFDGNDRLPATMPRKDVVLVRDALEHWDEPSGRANTKMAKRGADPSAHTWRQTGEGVLGDVIEDSTLKTWADAVYAELVSWSPW